MSCPGVVGQAIRAKVEEKRRTMPEFDDIGTVRHVASKLRAAESSLDRILEKHNQAVRMGRRAVGW